MVRRTEIAQSRMRFARQPVVQHANQARLADAGLAAQQDHLTLAASRPLPPTQQQLDFLFAPDERRQGLAPQRLEAAHDTALPYHLPRTLRIGKAGEMLRTETFDLEQCAYLPARAVGDDERTRLGQCLQPRGEVWGLADHPAFLRCAGADQITDDDKAACDAEPHIQRC